MESSSNLVESEGRSWRESLAIRGVPIARRFATLAHVNLDAANGAILRDLSEFGIAMQTVTPLAPDQQVQLRFDLPSPRLRIEAAGRIAWTDSWGQAGVQFVDLPERSQRLLKEWVFIQILSAAYLFAPCESAAVSGNHAEGADRTALFRSSPASHSDRAATHKSGCDAGSEAGAHATLPASVVPGPNFAARLSKLVDGLILLCAVLLFAVMSMAITDVLPTWWVTLPLAIAVTALFVGVYWFLFVYWFRRTPGEHLARMACFESGDGMYGEEEYQARFR